MSIWVNFDGLYLIYSILETEIIIDEILLIFFFIAADTKIQRALFDIFDKKRINITTTENLAIKPQKTFSEIFKFLEISDYEIPKPENKRQGVYSPMNKEIRMKLSSFFKPFNDDLYELLETKFNWNDEL